MAAAAVTVSGPGVDREFKVAQFGSGEDGARAAGRVALAYAQGQACRTLGEPGTLYVRDPAGDALYRVERDSEGVVLTYTNGAA